MRGLLIFICIGIMPYGASGLDSAEQRDIVSSVQSNMNPVQSSDAQKIRDFIKNEDPNFITSISTETEEKQLSLMRNWLAKKTFDFYYHKYMDEIQSQSAKTGRKIKMDKYGYDEKWNSSTTHYWWLDAGELDEPKCQQDSLARRACDYPDGFEEYSISYETIVSKDRNNVTAELFIMQDDVATNSRKVIQISLTIEKWDDSVDTVYTNGMQLWVQVTSTTEKYTEYHKYRNQEAADIRAGKYRVPTKKERAKYKNSAVGKLTAVTDDSLDWVSNYLPAASVVSATYDYTEEFSRSKS